MKTTSIKLVCDYDFSNGVAISKEVINKWNNEVLNGLSESPREVDTYFVRAGNSIVIGFKDVNGIQIFQITNGYRELEYQVNKDL
jgi:hypothetical protein